MKAVDWQVNFLRSRLRTDGLGTQAGTELVIGPRRNHPWACPEGLLALRKSARAHRTVCGPSAVVALVAAAQAGGSRQCDEHIRAGSERRPDRAARGRLPT